MNELFERALVVMDTAFLEIEALVAPPKRQRFRNGYRFRYEEKSIQQALVQKVARVITGLRAVRVLWEHGLFQEQGVMQRVLDELGEDILFLCDGLGEGKATQLHKEYLAAFYAEDFDDLGPVPAHTKPTKPPRKKIRASVIRETHKRPNDNSLLAAAAHLSSAYSGFVHAGSPQIE